MSLESKHKVNPMFSMSSMTDIIFLVVDILHADLLIYYSIWLTS